MAFGLVLINFKVNPYVGAVNDCTNDDAVPPKTITSGL